MGNYFASNTELLILQLLKDFPEGIYGLELVRASNEKLKRGTVYVVLGRLEEKGYVRSRIKHDLSHPGLPRPRYSVTAQGERVLEAAEIMGLQTART